MPEEEDEVAQLQRHVAQSLDSQLDGSLGRRAWFVNSVCNNVLLEYHRSLGKNRQMDDTHKEMPDKVLDLEGTRRSDSHTLGEPPSPARRQPVLRIRATPKGKRGA